MEIDYQLIVRLLTAAALGGVIGIERERMNRAAGLRTHIMVSLGSAMFTVLSLYAFKEIGRVNDPARIAAQIVSGIGFLGAGTIMKHGATVKGLTTAASLWVVASIGMAAGVGYFMGAVITTLVALLALIVLKDIEHGKQGKSYVAVELSFPTNQGVLSKLHQELEAMNVQVRRLDLSEDGDTTLLTGILLIPDDLSQVALASRLTSVGATHIDFSH